MSIYSFVTQDQLDELDDEPRTRFMQLAHLAISSLDTKTDGLDPSDEYQYRMLNELRFSCMNVLLASASRLRIEPFASWERPAFRNYGEPDWLEFKYDLDHYVTQIVLDNTAIKGDNSVAMLPRTRDEIRTYVHGLRDCIQKATMDDSKREALLKKLDGLEKELEKRRVSMIAVATIVYHLWAVPGSMWASYDIANKLLSNVMHSVAEAKADDDERRSLSAPEPVKALTAPIKVSEPQGFQTRRTMNFDHDLDDQVPF